MDPEKPKRTRRRILDLDTIDLVVEPESQIYTSRIKEYQERISRKDWRNELQKMQEEPEEEIEMVMEKTKPKRTQKKRKQRKIKRRHKEEFDVLCVSSPADSASETEEPPSWIDSNALSRSALRRLDRLKRASDLEIKRLQEEKARILATDDSILINEEDDESEEEENREIILRIRYLMDDLRIPTKRNEKFSSIISELSRRFNLNASEILLCFKDRNITVDDTPASLGISLVDVIECCIYRPVDVENVNVEDSNRIELKIQSNDCRSKTVLYVHKLETMQDIMQKYAEKRNIPVKDIIFEFDGEKIEGSETPDDLDMESGSCIDARIAKQ